MKLSKERRQHERKSCLLSVDWSVSNSVYTNTIKNISNGGMFIETSEPFEVGQEISLRILAPEHLKKIHQLNAKIVRTEDEGIAVKFLNDDDHQKELVRFLINNI
ncbi:MAG: PilZ domain-containing protein [Proteobacteria bacterium]|nr:PilZ domain-containing protein [Pseudomonadota bacterium]